MKAVKQARLSSKFVAAKINRLAEAGSKKGRRDGRYYMLPEEFVLFSLPVLARAYHESTDVFFSERSMYGMYIASLATSSEMCLGINMYSYKYAHRYEMGWTISEQIMDIASGFRLEYPGFEMPINCASDDMLYRRRPRLELIEYFSMLISHIGLDNPSGPLHRALNFREEKIFDRSDFLVDRHPIAATVFEKVTSRFGATVCDEKCFPVLKYIAEFIATQLGSELSSAGASGPKSVMLVDDGCGSTLTFFKSLEFFRHIGVSPSALEFVTVRPSFLDLIRSSHLTPDVDFLEDDISGMPMFYERGRRRKFSDLPPPLEFSLDCGELRGIADLVSRLAGAHAERFPSLAALTRTDALAIAAYCLTGATFFGERIGCVLGKEVLPLVRSHFSSAFESLDSRKMAENGIAMIKDVLLAERLHLNEEFEKRVLLGVKFITDNRQMVFDFLRRNCHKKCLCDCPEFAEVAAQYYRFLDAFAS